MADYLVVLKAVMKAEMMADYLVVLKAVMKVEMTEYLMADKMVH
jgi:hypothetical protein